jgi:hypothetical protein
MTSTRREVILIPYDAQRPIPSLYQLAVIEQSINCGKRQLVYMLWTAPHIKLQLAPLGNQSDSLTAYA